MNREILFRGKRVDNGEWVEGSFYQHPMTKDCFILVHDYHSNAVYGFGNLGCPKFHKVDPDTLGEYTGLTDKNGKKIWEGDICSADLFIPYKTVIFRNGCFMYQLNDGDSDYYDIMMPIEPLINADVYTEVIGNIHDNSDLIEECK